MSCVASFFSFGFDGDALSASLACGVWCVRWWLVVCVYGLFVCLPVSLSLLALSSSWELSGFASIVAS